MDVKTRIRFNGKEYSGIDELPPEVRVAFEKAMANRHANKRIVLNGQEFTDETQMRKNARNFYDDVMGAIENNGAVTLPTSRRLEPLMTKDQLTAVFLVVGMLFGIAVVALVRR